MALTNDDALTLVIELACLTEHRTDNEQRALLMVARGVDDRRNLPWKRRKEHGDLPAHQGRGPARPVSALEAFVDSTRVLHDGDKRVRLKRRKVDADPET